MAEPTPKTTKKELEVNGYKFILDTDLVDDVDAFEIIDRIENKNQVVAIIPLLHYLIGKPEYDKMKAHFEKADAAEHEGEEGYKGKFRMSKLSDVYKVIVDNFDPKG